MKIDSSEFFDRLMSEEAKAYIEMPIENANILKITAGSTGPKGGDYGHGSRAYFSIEDISSTAMDCKLIKDENGETIGFEVMYGGDSELTTMIEALSTIVQVLKDAQRR